MFQQFFSVVVHDVVLAMFSSLPFPVHPVDAYFSLVDLRFNFTGLAAML
jgi:hypothetical protein